MRGNVGGVVLLWALRSPCNLGCRYCYFSSGDGSNTPAERRRLGELSHAAMDDVSWDETMRFVASFPKGLIRRVFLAGGEPLMWREARDLICALKLSEAEVVVCTNGLPLRNAEVARFLIDAGVDAVSVSLDSSDASYNDAWRVDRRGVGWAGVVDGLSTLLKLRQGQHRPRIGVYMVVTRQNIDHLLPTASFVAELGCDYLVYQPVSLPDDHPLRDVLSLRRRHRHALLRALREVEEAGLPLRLPDPIYRERVVRSIDPREGRFVKACFGGRDLYFIQPDGSVWDCPSAEKIANTAHRDLASIVGAESATLFDSARRSRCTDCDLFSEDCVNMWQLMAFDGILQPTPGE